LGVVGVSGKIGIYVHYNYVKNINRQEIKMWIDYCAYRSKIKNWNSSYKVFVAFFTLCLVLCLDNICVSLFVFASMSCVTLFAGRTPYKIYFKLLCVPFTFIVLSGLSIMLQFSRTPVSEWGISLHFAYVYVTKSGIVRAVSIFFKAMACVSALYMMSLSTPVSEFVSVLSACRIPKIITELMNLIYRYIFILIEISNTMLTAVKARLGYKDFFTACKSFSAVAGNLFVISLKKANAYYDALVSRGYDGKLEFLTEEKPIKIWQIVTAVLYYVIMVIIFIVGRCVYV
jgi:cobalt/nickel transport system permease protein